MPTPFDPSFRMMGSKSGTDGERRRVGKRAVMRDSSRGTGDRSGGPERRVRRLGSFLGFGALLALPFFPPHGWETADSPARKAVAAPASSPVDSFATTVRPILREHCAPCHEPGGKMYEKLPFDKAETIAAHPEGVLKRLKGEDHEAVAKWLAALPGGAGGSSRQ